MMSNLLKYVEIKTKVTTSVSFLLAVAYLFYIKQPINWKLSGIFFLSMITMDLATTAINNYIDAKRGSLELQFKKNIALALIFVLLFISAASGLYLVYLTDFVVLFMGTICFLCGVFYTYGPVPISRLPLGELFSGVFQGFIGPFIVLYINMPQNTYMSFNVNMNSIDISLNTLPLLSVILLTVTPVCGIANIMLANNICDLELDVMVHRYTLAFYLKDNALYLYATLYYISYISVILMIVLKLAPLLLLLSLCTIIPVQININRFLKKQDKSMTFPLSIGNFMLITGANTILFFVGSWIKI